MSSEKPLRINRQVIKYQLLGFPGMIALGLGLLGLSMEGEQLFAFLENETVPISLVVGGALVMAWEAYMVIPLISKSGKKESDGT